MREDYGVDELIDVIEGNRHCKKKKNRKKKPLIYIYIHLFEIYRCEMCLCL